MDIDQTLRPRVAVEATHDHNGQARNRRSSADRDWIGDCYAVCEMFEGNENAWDALERRERMAEACYDI